MLAIATSLNARKGHLTPQGGLIGVKASHELLDQNLSADLLKQVRTAASSVQGVEVAAATGREHGSDVLVELSITVDPQLNVQAAAELAEQVRQAVCERVPLVGDVVVELNTDHLARLRQRLQ